MARMRDFVRVTMVQGPLCNMSPDGRDLALCKKTVFFNHVKIVFFNHFFFHLHCFSELFFSVFCKYEKQSKRWQKGIVFFSLKKLKISVTDYH